MILTPKLLPLLNAMQALQCIVPSKAVRQCTRFFHCSIVEGQLAIAASDIEISARMLVPCKAESFKPILLPPSLAPLIKDRPQDEFDIRVENNVATIKFGADVFELPLCADVAEWPEQKSADEIKARCTVNANAFAAALKTASMCAAKEAGRFAINSVAVRLNKGRLDVIGTDGKQIALTKLAIARHEDADGIFGEYSNCLPLKCAETLSRFCEEMDAGHDIEIGIGGGAIFAAREGFQFSAILMSGDIRFPKYESVLDKSPDKEAIIEKALLETALARASHFIGQESNAVTLAFDDGKVSISTCEAFKGRGTQVIACDYQGEPLDISVSPEYLLNACKVSGDHVKLSMLDADKIVLSGSENLTFGFMPRGK